MSNRLLLVGSNLDNSSYLSINKIANKNEAMALYGNGPLYNAYKEAVCFNSSVDVYCCNCDKYDIFSIINLIVQQDFDVISMIEIKIDDSVFSPLHNKSLMVSEIILDNVSKFTRSVVIFQSNKSSLYENLEHYLLYMKKEIDAFSTKCEYLLNLEYGENVIYIANNLTSYDYASAIAGAMFLLDFDAEIKDKRLGDTVYNIDLWDVAGYPIAYFKESAVNDTCIDNLVNFKKTPSICKNVLASRSKKYIEKILSFEEYRGKINAAIYKSAILKKASSILSGEKGHSIDDYAIDSLTFGDDLNYRLEYTLYVYGDCKIPMESRI